MSFAHDTPLEDVLKYIKQATTGSQGNPSSPGIPIYVDPKGLQEADKQLSSPVVMELEGVPLKTSLRLILKQLDLAYCVRDGVLIISSVQGISEELQECFESWRGRAARPAMRVAGLIQTSSPLRRCHRGRRVSTWGARSGRWLRGLGVR